MPESNRQEQWNILHRALGEARYYDIDIRPRTGQGLQSTAELLLDALDEAGLDGMYAYWKGHFIIYGII